MPRTNPDNPNPPPVIVPGGGSGSQTEQSPDPAGPRTPPPHGPPGNAMFRALLAAGVDADTAYTAEREMESIAAQNAAAQVGPAMDVFAARMDTAHARLLVQFQAALTAAVQEVKTEFRAELAEVKTEFRAELAEVKTGLATVTNDVATLKREIRLVWGCLSLLVVTLTAVLVRLFAG